MSDTPLVERRCRICARRRPLDRARLPKWADVSVPKEAKPKREHLADVIYGQWTAFFEQTNVLHREQAGQVRQHRAARYAGKAWA